MKQAVPDRWNVPTPGRPPGIVQLPPLALPGPPPPAPVRRRATSPWVVAALAGISGIVGAIGIIVLVVVLGVLATPQDETGLDRPVGVDGGLATVGASPPAPAAIPVQTLVVDVSGGVMQPGLRTLRVGDRVGDAIAAAGGFAPRADLAATSRSVNLAQPLVDGMKVLVPELGAEPERGAPVPADEDGRIDLNGASQIELESLPGIGPVTAQRIVEARDERPFASVEDLRDRDVVGQSVYEDIRDLVRVGGD